VSLGHVDAQRRVAETDLSLCLEGGDRSEGHARPAAALIDDWRYVVTTAGVAPVPRGRRGGGLSSEICFCSVSKSNAVVCLSPIGEGTSLPRRANTERRVALLLPVRRRARSCRLDPSARWPPLACQRAQARYGYPAADSAQSTIPQSVTPLGTRTLVSHLYLLQQDDPTPHGDVLSRRRSVSFATVVKRGVSALDSAASLNCDTQEPRSGNPRPTAKGTSVGRLGSG
jgi:hypothetical protein